jgi:cell division protein FtsB
MTQQELKEYLGIVVDMEEDIFLKGRLEKAYQDRISRLGHHKKIEAPVKKKPKAKGTSPPVLILGGILIIGNIIAFIVVSVLGWMHETVTDAIWTMIGMVLFLAAIDVVAIIILTIINCILIGIWSKLQSEDDYRADLSEYEKQVDAEKTRMREENRLKQYLELELDNLQTQRSNSISNLAQIYDKDVIAPKYRSFAMVSSLYEYICVGRCTSLEGADGAYNILEREILFNHIISKLDMIISRLDQIKGNQYMLYTAIRQANQKLDQLNESVQQVGNNLSNYHGDLDAINAHIAELQKTSAASAYFAERSKKELEYMNRVNYLTGRNGEEHWSVPPSL